jgi:hypothetical protein
VRHIKKFVEDESLEENIKKRPKRARLSETNASISSAPKPQNGQSKSRKQVIELDDDDDEFGGADIDFGAIDLPGGYQSKASDARSPHFG